MSTPNLTAIQQKILTTLKSLQHPQPTPHSQQLYHLTKNQQLEAEELFRELQPTNILNQKQKQYHQHDIDQEKYSQLNDNYYIDASLKPLNKTKEIITKSILKKGKQIAKNTKLVTFHTPENSTNLKQTYLISPQTRKWNEKLTNPRIGKFDPEQKKLLIQHLSQCLTIQNLKFQDIVKAMSEDNQKIPKNLRFWTKVCSILPTRTLVSSYKFLKRQLHSKNKQGNWNQQQIDNLLQLINKYGRKWAIISKQMHRTAQNIRDKYRQLGEQNSTLSTEQTPWKFQQLVSFLKYIQQSSKIKFLHPKLDQQLLNAENHNKIQQHELKHKKYNSKSFKFHNNEIIRQYITKQFQQLKTSVLNWQHIANQLQNKTVFDCRNKFVQLLQLQIYSHHSKQYYEQKIIRFIISQKIRYEQEIKWERWTDEQINSEQARNRWMIYKKHIQGRGQMTFTDLLKSMTTKTPIL